MSIALDPDHFRAGFIEDRAGQLPNLGAVGLGQLSSADRLITLEMKDGGRHVQDMDDVQGDPPPPSLPNRMSQRLEAGLRTVDTYHHRTYS